MDVSRSQTHHIRCDSLEKWSARRKGLYLTTHRTHKTDINSYDGIRTSNPSKRVAADPRQTARPLGLAMRVTHGWLLYLNKCGHESSGSVDSKEYILTRGCSLMELSYNHHQIEKSCNFWQNYVKRISIPSMTLSFGRVMAQAVSSRPLIAEALVRPQASPYGGTPAGFSEYFIFPPSVSLHQRFMLILIHYRRC
jgi:hypothetical protein